MEKINKNLLEKFLSYNLHCGSLSLRQDPSIKPFFQGIRNNFCILNLSETRLYLRYALRFLKKLLVRKKKILFLGGPRGMEKEFSLLCLEKDHFWIEHSPEGLFTNSEREFFSKDERTLKIDTRPSLIFIFDLTLYKDLKKETYLLDIPIMAFVNTDENLVNVDYPIPANIKSWKGGLFAYNLFFHLFHTYQN